MLAAVAAILLVAALLISMSIYSDQVYQQQVGDIALNGESNLWKKSSPVNWTKWNLALQL